MGLPAFPIKAFSAGGTNGYSYGVRSQNGPMVGIYGSGGADTVTHGISAVSNTYTIDETKLLEIAGKATQERARRGGSSITIPTGYYQGLIYASRVQDIRTVVEIKGPAASYAYNHGPDQGVNSATGQYVTGSGVNTNYNSYYQQTTYEPYTTYAPVADPTVVTYPQAPAPTMSYSFVKKDVITAENINSLISLINSAGQVCTCNCNYCTCNCNYCTCNCNYSCTCNCNY